MTIGFVGGVVLEDGAADTEALKRTYPGLLGVREGLWTKPSAYFRNATVIGALRSIGELGLPFDVLVHPTQLDDLYALTAGQNRPAIPIFFVRSIEGALGIASGIPGPHVLPGTGASGVAISVDLVPVDEMGVVIAHELGHYTGLFHTSEIDGRVNDPFPDTPECRLDRDTDGDGFLRPSECRGAGADHLKALARVSRIMRDRDFCDKLRGSDNPDAIFALLIESEFVAPEKFRVAS